MSGTSLDGIDAVLAEITSETTRVLGTHYLEYPHAIRTRLLTLHDAQPNEIHQAALLSNELARLYAEAVEHLLRLTGKTTTSIQAIGCHGQTLRHRPDAGYSLQIGNAALLAELTGLTVVSDFRNRDIAAGGQGAPLVPAFHAHALRHAHIHRVIVNIGGIANVSDLPPDGAVRGWDTGPGNMLMDAWALRHLNTRFDESGIWSASGRILPDLLQILLAHEYLHRRPPKSAGREQFNLEYLQTQIDALGGILPEPADVQATLLEFTARTLTDAIKLECRGVKEVYLCGGGVHNKALVGRISNLLNPIKVGITTELDIHPDWIEALAFAWLARQALSGQPGNLPQVTGASGFRVLGAIYPA